MGKAIAFDLVHSSPHYTITLADIDKERARQTADALGMQKVHPRGIDVRNHQGNRAVNVRAYQSLSAR